MLWLQLILEKNTAVTQIQTKPQAFHISLQREGDSSCYENRSLPSHVPRERKGLLPPGEQTTGESSLTVVILLQHPFSAYSLLYLFKNTIKALSTFPVQLSRSNATRAYTRSLMRDLKTFSLNTRAS